MKLILLFLFGLKRTTSLNNVFYGNYNNAIYNPLRNEYFWEYSTNIIPIDNNDAEMISFSWMIRDKNDFYETHQKFIKKDMLCYQWIPFKDKKDICALIQGNVYEKEEKIQIHTIFVKPYLETKQVEYLMSDLNQITLLKGFKDYSIETTIYIIESSKHLNNYL